MSDELRVRMRVDDKDALRAAATAAGMSTAEFARAAILDASRRPLAEVSRRIAEAVRTGQVQPPMTAELRERLADPEYRRRMFPGSGMLRDIGEDEQ